MTVRTWYTGYNNFQKLTLETGDGDNKFLMEILDVETQPFQTIQEIFNAHLSEATYPVEVLYSGGMDSECILKVCLLNNTPVTAITMRLIFRGSPINTHDLYYAEKFCRENNIPHKIVDLDYEVFFGNGDHTKFLDPYHLTLHNVASQLWLTTQCSRFPIIGGSYVWPQINISRKLYSPNRHEFAFFDVFMRDNGITGIGNMLGHSLESNIMLIKEHIKVYLQDPTNVDGDNLKIRFLKHRMFKNLGIGEFELRHKSYGWETEVSFNDWFNMTDIVIDSVKRNKITTNTLKWGQKLAEAIEGEASENSCDGTGDNFIEKLRKIINPS